MERYRNAGRDSGVSAFEAGAGYIKIRFRTGGTYTYSGRKAGSTHVANMTVLAIRGSGLNSYINRYVKFLYD